jgi:hypothetical protein
MLIPLLNLPDKELHPCVLLGLFASPLLFCEVLVRLYLHFLTSESVHFRDHAGELHVYIIRKKRSFTCLDPEQQLSKIQMHKLATEAWQAKERPIILEEYRITSLSTLKCDHRGEEGAVSRYR